MKVAIYVRVSTEEQVKEGFSIASQRSKLVQYCKLQDWDIYDIYIDEGISGSKLDRPELNRLREDISYGNVNMVLVRRVDRLFRSVYYLSTLLHEMEAKDVGFKSMTEGFDTSHPSGKAMLQMLAIFAEWERETIRERITHALYERARQGLHHAVPSFGYTTNEEGKLIPDENQAQVIRDIFELRNKDKSLFEIIDYIKSKYDSNILNENKSLTIPAHLSRILTNPVYMGKIKYKDEIFEGDHEGLVSEETFNQAAKRKQFRPGTHNFLFRGLLFCGLCGAKMYTKKQGNKKNEDSLPKQFYYYCSDSKASNYLLSRDTGECESRVIFEYVVLNQVRQIINDTSIELLEGDFDGIQEETTDYRQEIKDLEKKVKELRVRKNRYFDVFESDPNFEKEAKDRIKELSKSISIIENEKLKLIEKIANETNELDQEMVLRAANEIDMLINTEDREALREFFMILFKKVTVHPIPGAENKRIRSFVKAEWNV
jgi:site-specific DNA recombinase